MASAKTKTTPSVSKKAKKPRAYKRVVKIELLREVDLAQLSGSLTIRHGDDGAPVYVATYTGDAKGTGAKKEHLGHLSMSSEIEALCADAGVDANAFIDMLDSIFDAAEDAAK